MHQRIKSSCKECKGGSICAHGRIKSSCKECKGTGAQRGGGKSKRIEAEVKIVMNGKAVCCLCGSSDSDGTQASRMLVLCKGGCPGKTGAEALVPCPSSFHLGCVADKSCQEGSEGAAYTSMHHAMTLSLQKGQPWICNIGKCRAPAMTAAATAISSMAATAAPAMATPTSLMQPAAPLSILQGQLQGHAAATGMQLTSHTSIPSIAATAAY
jgi:hypothetical protein